MTRSSASTTLACVVSLCFAATAFGQAQDRIVPKSGRTLEGTITRMNADFVQIDTAPQPIKVADIKEIEFAGEPNELSQARARISSDRLEDAMEELNKINAKEDRIKAEVSFYKGYCQAQLALSGRNADATAAGTALKPFADSRDNFHHYQAAELMGRLAMYLEAYSTAESYFSKLLQADKASSPKLILDGALLIADAQMAQDKFTEAKANYSKVAGATGFGNDPEVARLQELGKIGVAACMAGEGTSDEAIKSINEVIKANDPKDSVIFGRAYNALGKSYRKAGRDKDALLAYLHTDVLFYGERDVHAEALYNLVELWQKLNRNDRSVSARTTLKSQYLGTRWAKLLK